MVNLREVHKQLKQIGYRFSFWMRREVIELSEVLDGEETIKQCVNGYYKGGFAILAATDKRLMLIDRKPMFLTLEVIWYDKIGQIDYNHRLLNATICIATPNKDLTFTSYNMPHLRQLLLYTQEKMSEANKPADQAERKEPQKWQYKTLPSPLEKALNSPASFPASSSLSRSGVQTSVIRRRLAVPSLALNKPSAHQTKYSTTRLPFSRRRYFAERQPQEL